MISPSLDEPSFLDEKMYLLYLNNKIIHGYGTIEILRLNLLILISKLLFSKKLNKIAYKKIEKYLLEYPFSFDDAEFKNELVDIKIKIELIEYENNSRSILEKINKGITDRLDQLEEILSKDIRITATIPGENAFKHRLGTMYIEDWKLIDEKNYRELAEDMHSHIAERLIELVDVFKERIKFEDVMYQNATNLNYQVWSANKVNYDLKEGDEIPGDYQAKEMKIQVPGVFGLVVTPRYGY